MNDYEFHLVEEVREGRLTRRELIQRGAMAGLSMSALGTLLAASGVVASRADENPSSKANGAGEPIQRGGIGRLAADIPTGNVDPIVAYDRGATAVGQMALEFLCYPQPDFTFEPKLAESWKFADSKTWTFNLRKNVRWHDGSPFTADDVVATFERILDPDLRAAGATAYVGVLERGNIEKIDDHTVVFHLSRGYTDFPTLVSAFNHGALILPKNYEMGEFAKGNVGTGPFILKEFRSGSGATYVRNPNYWASDRPYLDEIELKFYSDQSPMLLAMQGREVDVSLMSSYQGSEALRADPNINVLSMPSSEYRFFGPRVDMAPYDDKRVRQALATCLDREAIVKTLLGEYGQIGNDNGFAPVFPICERVVNELPQRKQDYELAKHLLTEAGYPNGLDIKLVAPRMAEITDYAVLIKEHCAPAGIRVEIESMSRAAYFGSAKSQPWFEVPLGIISVAARGTPTQTIDVGLTCGSIYNNSRWCDQRQKDLVDLFAAELDEQKRKQYALEAAQIEHDAAAHIIAYWMKQLRFVQKNVRGVPAGPTTQAPDVSKMWLAKA